MKEQQTTTAAANYTTRKLFFSPLVLNKVKDSLFRRGPTGIRGMSRVFKHFDSYDGNRRIDRQEFYVGLKEIGVEISKKDAEASCYC